MAPTRAVRTSGRAHWVAPNHQTRVPRAFVYLDTEAHRTKVGRREVQTFRLAVAAFDAVRKDRDGWKQREWCRATSPDELWEWVTGRCRRRARTVLVAHNLAYDLRISDAFVCLPRLGWRFVAGRVDDGQAWFVWRQLDRTLTCVDSTSWCPVSLERLGDAVELRKAELPDEDDSQDAWWARCERDVEILAEVWRRLMVWVENEDLGNWKLSGAGQSWAAFRHRFMDHRLLVHEDDDARDAERAASHTGRCEAWQHGKLTAGPYTEWDFHCAYATIGRDCAVPIKLAGAMYRPTLEKVLAATATRAVLVECEVTTDVPVLPVRGESGISWPVGSFVSTVWENELGMALATGARITVTRAWLYRRAPALERFCGWVLEGVGRAPADIDPVVRIALKHWSRALIGRTAARWSRWEVVGSRDVADVSLGKVHDVADDDVYMMMQLGNQLIRQVGAPDNPHAMGAILSWVMAEARCRLWEVMCLAGIENVVYVDTDSAIVNTLGSSALTRAAVPGLRIKGEWSTIEVRGPRQLIPGARLRAAGVPRNAARTGEDTWEADVWSGLSRSLASGQSSSVEVATRTFHLPGVDRRRRHLQGGLTAPFELRVDGAAATG